MTHIERTTPIVKLNLKRQSVCDYSDAYIRVKGTTTISNSRTAVAPNN